MIENKLKSQSLYEILENEIYNKIMKYNYKNNFEIKDVYNDKAFTYEIFKNLYPKFINSFLIKSSITGKIYQKENLNEFNKIFSKFLKDNSYINDKDKDLFNQLSFNRILDDSYIFRKFYDKLYLEDSSILNIYQVREYDDKTFLCLKLLEIIMSIQFTSNDLLNIDTKNDIDLKDIKNFSQGLLINDGKILVINF
jgi:hypothetical protein